MPKKKRGSVRRKLKSPSWTASKKKHKIKTSHGDFYRWSHKYVATWPRRIVSTERTHGGVDLCDCCRKKFNLWVCSNKDWNQLSPRHRKKFLCVKCFKRIVKNDPFKD